MVVNLNNPPVPFPNPYPYPLATPLSNRKTLPIEGNGFQKNAYVDKQKDGSLYVVGRPGFSKVFNAPSGGTPQGMTYWRGYLMAAVGNVLFRHTTSVAVNHATGSAWTAETVPPWQPRRAAASVVFKGQIILIGGYNGVVVYNDVWGSSDGAVWTQLCAAAPWPARQAMRAVVFNERLYMMGGLSLAGAPLNDVWVTDDGNVWTQVSSNASFSPRWAFEVVAFNSGMLLMGGTTGGAVLNDVWFSTDGSNWNQLVANATWGARQNFAAEVLGDKVYVYGGEDLAGNKINQSASSKDGLTWAILSGACWPDGGHSNIGHCVYEAKLWAIAGEITAGVIINDIYSSTDGAVWNLVTAAPGFANRQDVSAVVFRTRTSLNAINTPTMYALAGFDGVAVVGDSAWRSDINGATNASWALPSPTSNLPIQFTTALYNDYLVAKDTAAMFVFRGNTADRVTDPNYPATTVPGVVNLNETIYVMDPEGIIYGSAIENPLVYPAFKFIGADYESDTAVALGKHKSYVVAFGEYTTELFYDAGAEYGPVLRPVQNVQINIGCYAPYSVVDADDRLIWVGRGKNSRDRRVYQLRGTQVTVISDAMVEHIINVTASLTISATFVSQSGHRFYVLKIPELSLSLACDLDTNFWFEIDFKAAMWDLMFSATTGNLDYYMRQSSGEVYSISDVATSDDGTPITVDIFTNLIDLENAQRCKHLAGVSLVCDRDIGDVLIRYLKGDYQASPWSAFRTFNTAMTIKRQPRLARFGDFYRLAFHLRHTSTTKRFRAERLELELSEGFV